MRIKSAAFCLLALCVICLDEQSIAVLASPRAMLVYMLALWLCCERCVRDKCEATKVSMYATVKENHELSQTVMNLSEQHRLLCEIRNNGLKSLRYSKDTFVELKFPSTTKKSTGSKQESKASETHLVETDSVLKARAAFHRGSMSDSYISQPRRASLSQ